MTPHTNGQPHAVAHEGAPRRRVLGVILSQFPRYDEAFILRELVELARGPWELAIFSLRPCRDRIIHEQAKPLQPNTRYAAFCWSAEVWRSHARYLRRNPRAYVGALGWIISRHWRHPVALLKTLALFPKTVHFARLAEEAGCSHLHAFWASYPATAAIVIERLAGIPYSLSGHAHDIYTVNPALPEKLRGARFVMTCTQANREHLVSLVDGARPGSSGRSDAASRIVVSYHGVDLERFAPAPKPFAPVCRILAVGSLLPCKGYETLIEACRLLKAKGVPFLCTIAGGGPLESSLRTLMARTETTEDIEITGYVSQERVVGLYQRSHVVVLPLVSKIHWGIPNVLIEALATKTPVISCALPSMRELIEHGRSGCVIPERDPATLAEAVAALWADPSLRERIAEAGYRRVQDRFALAKTGQRLRDLFAQHWGRAAA